MKTPILIGHHWEKHLYHWVPERQERKKGEECLFKEITAENFPNLKRDLDIQGHEGKK